MFADDLPDQLGELLAAAGSRDWPADHPFRHVRAAPYETPLPPIYLLGSSEYSALVAAQNGFGFAFATHIAPTLAVDVLRIYRERFQPSPEFGEPYAILAHAALLADDEATARRLAAPARLAFRRLRAGRPGPIPTVDEALAELGDDHAPGGDRVVVGTPETVRDRFDELLAASGADELMVLTTTHGHAERRRSYELLAEAYHLGDA
jgi:luciferase family oxidoreductase group 1